MRRGGRRDAARATNRDWEELGRRDPYFAVLTDEQYRSQRLSAQRRQQFFASGEHHVAALFAAIDAALGVPLRPRRALDFGCGVGRVLGPLAARCERVVGADVAESMLAEARRVCTAAQLANVELVRVDEDLDAVGAGFDLIHAALVFQHVEPRRGERLIAALGARLAPGGVAALHVPTATRVPRWERWLARARRDLRPLHAVLNIAAGRDAGYPLMQMNLYDRARLRAIGARCGALEIGALPWREARYEGVVLLLRRGDGV